MVQGVCENLYPLLYPSFSVVAHYTILNVYSDPKIRVFTHVRMKFS